MTFQEVYQLALLAREFMGRNGPTPFRFVGPVAMLVSGTKRRCGDLWVPVDKLVIWWIWDKMPSALWTNDGSWPELPITIEPSEESADVPFGVWVLMALHQAYEKIDHAIEQYHLELLAPKPDQNPWFKAFTTRLLNDWGGQWP